MDVKNALYQAVKTKAAEYTNRRASSAARTIAQARPTLRNNSVDACSTVDLPFEPKS